MQAGILRRRVDIQQPTVTRDAAGGTVSGWATIWTAVPCAIDSLTGRETFLAQQVQSDITTKVTMRWRRGIDTTMRLRQLTGRSGDPDQYTYYNIEAVLPDPTGTTTMMLMCRIRLNDGFRKESGN